MLREHSRIMKTKSSFIAPTTLGTFDSNLYRTPAMVSETLLCFALKQMYVYALINAVAASQQPLDFHNCHCHGKHMLFIVYVFVRVLHVEFLRPPYQ